MGAASGSFVSAGGSLDGLMVQWLAEWTEAKKVQGPISRGKISVENSTRQNFSELNLKLFPMFSKLSIDSTQLERNFTLNFVS